MRATYVLGDNVYIIYNVKHCKKKAPKREKLAVDLPNHGYSPRTTASRMTYADLAGDIVSLLDGLGIERAVLVGHSMGGKVAMQTALENAERVAALVVVDIAPVVYRPARSDAARVAAAMAAVDPARESGRAAVSDALRAAGLRDDALRAFALTGLTRGHGEKGGGEGGSDGKRGRGAWRWKTDVDAVQGAMQTLMGFPTHGEGVAYHGRTCVVRGGRSQYVPFGVMPAFAKLFPNMKLVTISEAGHWVQAQTPQQFVNAVNDFLADEGDADGQLTPS